MSGEQVADMLLRIQGTRDNGPYLLDALLALYHAIPQGVMDGAPELEQAYLALVKVTGSRNP